MDDPRPRTLAAPPGGVLHLAAGGERLQAADRDRLLAEVRAGKVPPRLTLEAVVFRQTAEPNRNFIRFRPAILARLGASFAGAPFLRDHEQRELAARGGTVVRSAFAEGEIRQTIELVKPWSIEAALDGTLDRFSIGWNNTADLVCSVCEAPFFRSLFGHVPGCEHSPGDEIDGQVVEMLVTGAEGVETSAVSVPAVTGTGIQEIRAALAAHRGAPRPKERPMKELATKLGLTETADEPTVLAAVERLRMDKEAAAALHAAEVEAHAGARRRIAELEGTLAQAQRAETEARIEALLIVTRRKVGQRLGADGQPERGGTDTEALVLQLAAESLERAEGFVSKLPQLIPIGLGSVAAATRPSLGDERARISEEQRRVNRQLGLSDELYLKHGREV